MAVYRVSLGAAACVGAAYLAYRLTRRSRRKRVFVSGCFDLLHSGHGWCFFLACQLMTITNFGHAHSSSLFRAHACHRIAVAFFKEAAALGDLYVSVGNDANVTALKQKPMFPEEERVYMVGSIRWVHKAFVAKGMGHDQGPDLDDVNPDIFFVNEDGDKESKARQCAQRGIEYIVARRQPDAGLEVRSSTSIKARLK